MCTSDDEEWAGGGDGYAGGSVDTMQVVAPSVVVTLSDDLYAGVTWEEIHPPLIDGLSGPGSTDLQAVIDDIDLSALEELGLLQPQSGAYLP